MAIKIDLEKTYDISSCDFVKETFNNIKISQRLVDIIWCCIL